MNEQRQNLIIAYLPLCTALAKRYERGHIPWEDWLQSARLGMVKAAAHFDSSKGTFGAYAKPWMVGEMLRLQRQPVFNLLKEDRLPLTDEWDEIDCRLVCSSLPKSMAQVAWLYFWMGLQQWQIALLLGVSQSTVSRREKQINNLFRQAWLTY